jgi:hypothetical protein
MAMSGGVSAERKRHKPQDHALEDGPVHQYDCQAQPTWHSLSTSVGVGPARHLEEVEIVEKFSRADRLVAAQESF